MSSIQDDAVNEAESSWRELFNRAYLPKLATLALALWLHASNSMLTATTMPSAIDEIGGIELISWTFALYLAGSIAAAASMSLLVTRLGLKMTMIYAALVFAGGSALVAIAPSMPVLLIGRVLQGLGGGGLIALVYVSQDRFFPNHLVPKIVAYLSTVWMVAAFSGPLIGGAFATAGEWRMAYWAFAAQGLLLVPAVHFLLGASETELESGGDGIPIVRLLLLSASILLVSLSASNYHPVGSPVLIGLGCLALFMFIFRDTGATRARMLPSQVTDLSHAIGSGILATFLLSLSIMSFIVYGPFILIELYGMSPLQAGLVILIESLAWGSAAILFSGTRAETEPRLIKTGGACVLIGLVALALALPGESIIGVIVSVIVLNGGMGMMWGFIIKRVIAAAPNDEKDRTSSLLPITQQTGFALGAALSGLIANSLGIDQDPGPQTIRDIAFWLFAGFVPIVAIGNLLAWRFVGAVVVGSADQTPSR